MEYFTRRQIGLFAIALMFAGILKAWDTKTFLERYVLHDPTDPLTRQGGLSPDQKIEHRIDNEQVPRN